VKNPFRDAKFAGFSLGCVVASYVFYGIYVKSGMYHRLGSPMDNVGRFTALSPCLIGIVLALASVIWNPRKAPGLVALIVSILGTWVLFRLGG
jgi:hypothetical protein